MSTSSSGRNVIVDERMWNKPLPNVDVDTQPFWDGLREHRFLLSRCRRCRAWYWPPSFCRNHENDPRLGDLGWEEASGRGTIFALAIVYRAFHPGYAEDLPYAHALIELEEKPLMSSMLVDCDPEQAAVGQTVELVYEDHPREGFTLPKFRLRGDTGRAAC